MAREGRAGILLTVLVVAFGLGGAAAGAKKKHRKTGEPRDSQVTLTHRLPNRFAGSVGSRLDACRGSRVVTLSQTDPESGQTLPLSVQRTGGDGKYEVVLTRDAFFGTYRAQVAQRKIRANKAPQTCKAAESKIIVLQ